MEKISTINLYEEALNILTSQGKFYINLGLERVKSTLALIDNPQKNLNFIHVAGTNGKGSVCAILSAILQQGTINKTDKNPKVGLFTSPHVFEYTERIKINDIEISKENFAQRLINIVKLTEKNNIHLTEFEILTVVALQYFADENIDIVILETGLGGRLDATNIIGKNICSVITHIDLDHTERLGNTIEKIAFEKAGIIKKNCPVVISAKNLGFSTVKSKAEKLKSQIIYPKEAPNFLLEKLALKGNYQAENLALALKAIEIINNKTNSIKTNEEQIIKGLKNIKHPCRFEYLKEKNIIIDGAHNPNGTIALRESLDANFSNQNFTFIFGCLNNKNYEKMTKSLFRKGDEIYFYHFSNPNSCTVEQLNQVSPFEGKDFSHYVQGEKVVVICGSFYMIKELLHKMGIK